MAVAVRATVGVQVKRALSDSTNGLRMLKLISELDARSEAPPPKGPTPC
jgi:hypothetical protein